MHIFRAGTQITAAGDEIQFSEADLAASARAYDPAIGHAPICVGHPKTDAPAYGWVRSLSASGPDLLAEREQVQAEFAEMCREGRFKKVSAAFYAPTHKRNPVKGVWYLRHVAFLGAEPPAVKGLRDVEFGEGDDDGACAYAEVEFSDPAITSVGDMFGRLRDWWIGKFGLDEADKVLPRWQIDSINELGTNRPYPMREDERASASPAFSEGNPRKQESDLSNTDPQLQAERDAAIKRADDAEKALREQNEAAARQRAQARHADAVAFAESLVTDDRLLPKDRDLVVAAIDAVEGETAVEFGEGEARQPLGKALRTFLQALPRHALNDRHLAGKQQAGDGADTGLPEFSEGTRVDDGRMQLHLDATALAKDKGIPYIDAVRQIKRG